MVQRVTTSDNKWQRVKTSHKEWRRVTTNDNEWPFRQFIYFFQVREEPTIKHPKENSLSLEEDLWRRPIKLWPETSSQEVILTVRSKNCRNSCSQIFTKIIVLKNFAIFTEKHLCRISFLGKLQVLKPANLLKGDSNRDVFLWILRNF